MAEVLPLVAMPDFHRDNSQLFDAIHMNSVRISQKTATARLAIRFIFRPRDVREWATTGRRLPGISELGWLACGFLFVATSLLAADTRTIEPLKSKNLEGWKFMQPKERSHWTVGKASLDPNDPSALKVTADGDELINTYSRGIDIYTVEEFGDCHLELEVMVPKGANSGVFLLREYEVQILDSYGRTELKTGDMGGIYGVAAPAINATKAPGEWQRLSVDFRAPRFDKEGSKISNAVFVLVTLNGEILHRNLEVKNSTTGTTRKEKAQGPIRLQGDHGPVAFRKIKIITAN